MSETRFPPSGTKCKDCGCCLATVYAGNDALCWECDEGEPCKGKQLAPARAAETPGRATITLVFDERELDDYWDSLALEQKAYLIQLQPVPRPTIQTSAAPLPHYVRQKSHSRVAIAESVKAACIADRAAGIRPRDIAQTRNVGYSTVVKILRDAPKPVLTSDPASPAPVLDGISPAAASEQDRTPRAEMPQEAPVPTKPMIPSTPEPAPQAAPESGPAIPPGRATLVFDERELDDYWDSLALEQKAYLIQLQLGVDLRGGA